SGEWRELAGGAVLHFETAAARHSTRIAAFDFDGTIAGTRSGAQFPKNTSDWSILWGGAVAIRGKLAPLHAAGYKLAILSNQLGVGKGHESRSDVEGRVGAVVAAIGLPMDVYLATCVS
ncbi:unnamed protein product, partial [Phaeothamnion confervicola]